MACWMVPRTGGEAGSTSGAYSFGWSMVGGVCSFLGLAFWFPGMAYDGREPPGGPLQPCAIGCCGATCPDGGGVILVTLIQPWRAVTTLGRHSGLDREGGNRRFGLKPTRRGDHEPQSCSLVQDE